MLREPIATYRFCVSFYSFVGASDFEAYLKSESSVFSSQCEGNLVTFIVSSSTHGDRIVREYESLALGRQEKALEERNLSPDAVI